MTDDLPCTCEYGLPCYENTDKCDCGCPHHDARHRGAVAENCGLVSNIDPTTYAAVMAAARELGQSRKERELRMSTEFAVRLLDAKEVQDALEDAAQVIVALKERNAVLQGIIDKNSAAIQFLEGHEPVAYCPHCNKSIP